MAAREKDETIAIKTANGIRHVRKEDIIYFPDGIPGFEDYTDFVFFDIKDCEPFRSMLSVVEGGPDFVVVETRTVLCDYLPPDTMPSVEELDLGTPLELVILSIVTLADKPEDITINLRGPLFVNLATSRAKQVIIDDERYQTRKPILVRD